MSNLYRVRVRWVSIRYCQRSGDHGSWRALCTWAEQPLPLPASHVPFLGATLPTSASMLHRGASCVTLAERGKWGTWSTGPVTHLNSLFKKQCQSLTRMRCRSSSMQRSRVGVKTLLAELGSSSRLRAGLKTSLWEVWAKLNFSYRSAKLMGKVSTKDHRT